MNDRITWLIPVKNGMPYLTETLASIQAQTFTNWEVLVWDNGSTDGTIEELKRWIPNILPGRLVIEEPLTLGGSLARMVEICETEICARIDADDINLPERLETQLKFLSTHPEIAVLGSWMYTIDESGKKSSDICSVPLNHNDIINTMITGNAMAHPSVIFKRSAVLNVGNYRDLYFQKWNEVNIEDFDLWLRISQCYRLENINIPLVKYRVHHGSTTQIAIKENRMNQAVNNCLLENSPLAFGCSESNMRLLRERNHPFAIRSILQIAKHLQQIHGGTLMERLSSPSFIYSAKKLVSYKDIISRLLIVSFHPNKLFLCQEIKSIIKLVLLNNKLFNLLTEKN
jgi:glycosyltransferase involved in cell wall biosynthesis